MPGALAIVEETLQQGHQLVSELLRDADMGLVVHRREGAHRLITRGERAAVKE